MRKFYVLCAALFCLSLTASAQDSTAALDVSSPAGAHAEPAGMHRYMADTDPEPVALDTVIADLDTG